jgi:uncharacterized protein YndB with AHSA1/START domain
MTKQKSFKRLVRTRMEKTGESYTSARAALLDGGDERADWPTLTTSEEALVRRTGNGWEHWFDLLDEWGATERSHKEMATWLREEQEVAGWWAQAITTSYERVRGMRAVGERPDGFVAGASKTVAVPVDRLFDAWVDSELRRTWLPDAELRERTATRPRNARYDWGDGATRVVVGFEPKGGSKATVSMSHERLDDAEEADRMKAYWRERLSALKQSLEA